MTEVVSWQANDVPCYRISNLIERLAESDTLLSHQKNAMDAERPRADLLHAETSCHSPRSKSILWTLD